VWVDRGLGTVGDEELLRRAVDNLLTNVLVHTPAGTVGTVGAVIATTAGDRRAQRHGGGRAGLPARPPYPAHPPGWPAPGSGAGRPRAAGRRQPRLSDYASPRRIRTAANPSSTTA